MRFVSSLWGMLSAWHRKVFIYLSIASKLSKKRFSSFLTGFPILDDSMDSQ